MPTTPLDILCIEDSPADFHLIQRELRKAGLLGFCQRVDGSEALRAALAQHRWDLVLSDYSVPGMYFTDTLKVFLRGYRDLPLILVSGTIGEAKAGIMVELGASGFVPKNRLSELVPTIEQVLQRRAESRDET
ncbi:MAG: response regulator [Sterolibacteriaceae bacterium]|uniref:Response regulator n=1 Tax=Candidatus Methylophosphatis roskildensis TaxID=2899263 RepID=A0A9D7E1W7_9PROT|nr:response regulator [Candidatus Methylophosphatis roskildensis]MBK7237116.1 response regulator [Sterolibacteriaceae bacterium]MBK9084081.1 response regulator [Sterolibacteriaceae bacterium]